MASTLYPVGLDLTAWALTDPAWSTGLPKHSAVEQATRHRLSARARPANRLTMSHGLSIGGIT